MSWNQIGFFQSFHWLCYLVAILIFTSSCPTGLTPLIFQEVDVRDDNNVDLGFGHSEGDLIHVDPAVPVTASSFGALKALFR